MWKVALRLGDVHDPWTEETKFDVEGVKQNEILVSSQQDREIKWSWGFIHWSQGHIRLVDGGNAWTQLLDVIKEECREDQGCLGIIDWKKFESSDDLFREVATGLLDGALPNALLGLRWVSLHGRLIK